MHLEAAAMHTTSEESATERDQTLDPVCGMSVDRGVALARGLHVRHAGVDYYFCGKGCKLDFDDDPERFLDPTYVPAM
jgi:Cu+-exporting ATPase